VNKSRGVGGMYSPGFVNKLLKSRQKLTPV
jgi:hypothetical protein